MHQSVFDFDARDLAIPVSGHTPSARHASFLGAVAHREVRGRRILAVLAAFRAHDTLTLADCAGICGVQVHAVCSTWAKLKELGWIEGTGTFDRYTAHGHTVRRERHRLTARGQDEPHPHRS